LAQVLLAPCLAFDTALRAMPFILDEWWGVTLPKTVFIQNSRLGAVDWTLKIGVIAYVVADLWNNDLSYTTSYVPHSAVSVWAENGGFKDSSQADHASAMCDANANDYYDYLYDKAGVWTYTNQSCIELPPRERSMKTARSLFVPTYVQQSFTSTKLAKNTTVGGPCTNALCASLGKCPDGMAANYTADNFNSDGQCMCQCVKDRQMFATGVNALQVGITHLPQYPHELLWEMRNQDQGQPTNLKDLNMWTVVRDANKKEFKRIAPGAAIMFTMEQVLDLGGGFKLDDANRGTNENYFLGDDKLPLAYKNKLTKYPAIRITGAQVTMAISYFNRRSTGYSHDKDESHGEAVCYLDIAVLPTWQSNPIADNFESNDAGEGSFRSRYFTGIRVEFATSGSYSFVDVTKLLIHLASAFVYFSLPNILMVLITKFCLGTLSEIYYKAQTQLLDTWELFAGQVCRALVGMFAFQKLTQEAAGSASEHVAGDKTHQKSNIRLRTLRRHVHNLMEEQEGLDEKEIDALLNVLLRVLDKEGDREVSQVCFVDAVVNSDVCSLRNWANLFDDDRRTWFLEALFDTNAKKRKELAKDDARATVVLPEAEPNAEPLSERSIQDQAPPCAPASTTPLSTPPCAPTPQPEEEMKQTVV